MGLQRSLALEGNLPPGDYTPYSFTIRVKGSFVCLVKQTRLIEHTKSFDYPVAGYCGVNMVSQYGQFEKDSNPRTSGFLSTLRPGLKKAITCFSFWQNFFYCMHSEWKEVDKQNNVVDMKSIVPLRCEDRTISICAFRKYGFQLTALVVPGVAPGERQGPCIMSACLLRLLSAGES